MSITKMQGRRAWLPVLGVAFCWTSPAGANEALSITGLIDFTIDYGNQGLDAASQEIDLAVNEGLDFNYCGVTSNGLTYCSHAHVDDDAESYEIDESFVLGLNYFGSAVFGEDAEPLDPPVSVQAQTFTNVQRDYFVTFEGGVPQQVELQVNATVAMEVERSRSFGFGNGLTGGIVVQLFDRDASQLGGFLFSYTCSNFGIFGCVSNPDEALDESQQTDLSNDDSEIFSTRVSLKHNFNIESTPMITLDYGYFYQQRANFETPGETLRHETPEFAEFTLKAVTPGVKIVPIVLPEPTYGQCVSLLGIALLAARRQRHARGETPPSTPKNSRREALSRSAGSRISFQDAQQMCIIVYT